MSTSWQWRGKSQDVVKMIRIHPLGGHKEIVAILQIVPEKFTPRWWTNQTPQRSLQLWYQHGYKCNFKMSMKCVYCSKLLKKCVWSQLLGDRARSRRPFFPNTTLIHPSVWWSIVNSYSKRTLGLSGQTCCGWRFQIHSLYKNTTAAPDLHCTWRPRFHTSDSTTWIPQ